MDPVHPIHYFPSMDYLPSPLLPPPDTWHHIQPWAYHRMPAVLHNSHVALPEESPPPPAGSPKTPKQRKKVFRLERSSSSPSSPSPSPSLSPSPYGNRKIRPKLNISPSLDSSTPPSTPIPNNFSSPQNPIYSPSLSLPSPSLPSPSLPPPSNFKETLSELWGFLGIPKGEHPPKEPLPGGGFPSSPSCRVSPRHLSKRKNPSIDRWQSALVSGSPMHATAGSSRACHVAEAATSEDDKNVLSFSTHSNSQNLNNNNSNGCSMWPVSVSPSYRAGSLFLSSSTPVELESVGGGEVTAGGQVTSLWAKAGSSPRGTVPSASPASYASSPRGAARWTPPDFGHLPEGPASCQPTVGRQLSTTSLLATESATSATAVAMSTWSATSAGSPRSFLRTASENLGTGGAPTSLPRQHSQPLGGEPRVSASLALPRSVTCGSFFSSGQLETPGLASEKTKSLGNARSSLDERSGCFRSEKDDESFFLKDDCEDEDGKNVCFMEKEDVDKMISEIGGSEMMPLDGSLPPLAQLMMTAVSPEEDLVLGDWVAEPIDFCQLAASLSASAEPAGSGEMKTVGRSSSNSCLTENGTTEMGNGAVNVDSGLSWVVRGLGNGTSDSQIGNVKKSIEFYTPLLMNEEDPCVVGRKRFDLSQSDERSNSSEALQTRQSVRIQSGSLVTPTKVMPGGSGSLCHLSPSQPFVLPIRPQARSRAAAAIYSAHQQRQAELAGLPAGTATWAERKIKREVR